MAASLGAGLAVFRLRRLDQWLRSAADKGGTTGHLAKSVLLNAPRLDHVERHGPETIAGRVIGCGRADDTSFHAHLLTPH